MARNTSQSRNLLLNALPPDAYQRLAPHLTPVSFPLGTVLYQPLDFIDTIYFPERAVISLVRTLEDGATAEIGIVGFQGMIGLQSLLGSNHTPNRVVVQVADLIYTLPATILQQEFRRGEALQRILLRYTEARLTQVSQQVACNVHHNLQERLARWLLSVQDLVQSNQLNLTQKFIAQMLGVRRSTVTVTAGMLQEAGMISYKRGRVTILNQTALEQTSCDCYYRLKAEFSRILDFD